MARIFLSYAHEGRVTIERLDATLTGRSHKVWWDKGLRAGESFQEEIEENIASADAIVVLWTEISIGKRWVIGEATLAQNYGKLVPVRIGKGVLPPGALGKLHIENLTEWSGDKNAPEIDRLVERIARLKAEADAAKLAKLAPVSLREIVHESNSLKVLFNTGLPGGLRVYRLLLGALLTAAAIWAGLYAIQFPLDVDGRVELKTLGYIFLLLLVARIGNDVIIASKRRFIDRFFDPSFAFFCMTSFLLGTLGSIVSRLFRTFDLFQLVSQAVALSLYILAGLYCVRVILLGIATLQRRID